MKCDEKKSFESKFVLIFFGLKHFNSIFMQNLISIFIQNVNSSKMSIHPKHEFFLKKKIPKKFQTHFFQIQSLSDRSAAFAEQLEARKEFYSTGSVDGSIYKSYLQSVDSPFLVIVVIILFIVGQISISAVDLIVSKW